MRKETPSPATMNQSAPKVTLQRIRLDPLPCQRWTQVEAPRCWKVRFPCVFEHVILEVRRNVIILAQSPFAGAAEVIRNLKRIRVLILFQIVSEILHFDGDVVVVLVSAYHKFVVTVLGDQVVKRPSLQGLPLIQETLDDDGTAELLVLSQERVKGKVFGVMSLYGLGCLRLEGLDTVQQLRAIVR